MHVSGFDDTWRILDDLAADLQRRATAPPFAEYEELSSVRGIQPSSGASYHRRTPKAEVIRPWRITRHLALAAGTLLILGAGGQPWLHGVLQWLSSGLLMAAAALIGLISASKVRRGSPFTWHWISLAVAIGLLSLLAGAPITAAELPVLDWFGTPASLPEVLGWSAWGAAIGVIYPRFLLHLPPEVRRTVLLAAIVYAAGALLAIQTSLPFLALPTAGKALEMLGGVILLHALLAYAAARQLAFRFQRDDTPPLMLGPDNGSGRT